VTTTAPKGAPIRAIATVEPQRPERHAGHGSGKATTSGANTGSRPYASQDRASYRVKARQPQEGTNLDLQFAATAFATAITIIDPLGMIPLTIVATSGVRRSRQRIVNEAVLVAAGVILAMGLVGRALLAYLGITLPAFTIAGGLLLFLIAIDMLFARPTGAKQTKEETREARDADNPAVFPLAIPMIAGPGTIATVLLLAGLTHGDEVRILTVFLAYATALAVTWLCMSAATYLQRIIGKTGIHVVTRLLGIILAALAVQFVINGLAGTPFFTHA
jgi:multiple antibiotic resistance protein